MKPASGEMGTRWVKDDKSQSSSQAESTNMHTHLIYQGHPRQPLGLSHFRGHGLALRHPFVSKKLWDSEKWQSSQSCQQARGGSSIKGEGGKPTPSTTKWTWVRPKHSLEQNPPLLIPVKEPKAQMATRLALGCTHPLPKERRPIRPLGQRGPRQLILRFWPGEWVQALQTHSYTHTQVTGTHHTPDAGQVQPTWWGTAE